MYYNLLIKYRCKLDTQSKTVTLKIKQSSTSMIQVLLTSSTNNYKSNKQNCMIIKKVRNLLRNKQYILV